MLSVQQAQTVVMGACERLAAAPCALAHALGLVLAEDVTSDLDMPPFDKALVDGFAVRSADLPGGCGQLGILGELFAGQTPAGPLGSVQPGTAIRIMTGAPVPDAADAVVMQERTASHDGPSRVSIDDPRLRPGQNIMRRGTEMTCGQTVLRAGTRIRPPEAGLLAAVGRVQPAVYARPRVAVIATGNEIADGADPPGPGRIRNSNGPTLAGLVERAGGTPHYLGIAGDRQEDLRRLLEPALGDDVVVLSGGVSAGQLDLVPGVLGELGVRQLFHKVHFKPGKPIWFGVSRQHPSVAVSGTASSHMQGDHLAHRAGRSSLVFGLPGNPVSVVVCFELFVAPAIRALAGRADAGPFWVRAPLAEARPYRSDRPTYWPARWEDSPAGRQVRALAWQGSADLRALSEANAFVLFPEGDHAHRAGDLVDVLVPEW